METSLNTIQETLSQIQRDIRERLAALETSVDALTRAAGKRRTDPQWLDLDAAATLAGRSKRAVQNLIRREREKASGFSLRVQHGAVNRQDFLSFMESKQKPARGQIVRDAVNAIL